MLLAQPRSQTGTIRSLPGRRYSIAEQRRTPMAQTQEEKKFLPPGHTSTLGQPNSLARKKISEISRRHSALYLAGQNSPRRTTGFCVTGSLAPPPGSCHSWSALISMCSMGRRYPIAHQQGDSLNAIRSKPADSSIWFISLRVKRFSSRVPKRSRASVRME